MKLKVPLVRQGKGAPDCGPACAAMILQFYGFGASIEKIKKEMGSSSKKGMFHADLGSYLLSKNFDVELITFCPNNLVKSELPIDLGIYLERLKKNSGYAKTHSKRLERFSKSGGTIVLKIPTLEDIAMEIETERPLIVGLTNRFVLGKIPKVNCHLNVVTGIDDQFVYVNDPIYGKRKYDKSDFLFGLYVMACCNTSGLLAIKEKSLK